MNAFLQKLSEDSVVITLLIGIIVSVLKLVQAYISIQTKELANKIQNEELRKYILSAESAITAAVTSISQEMVDQLKSSMSDGKLSPEEQIKLKALAKERALQIMGEQVKNGLSGIYNDVDMWIDSYIETCVRNSKK